MNLKNLSVLSRLSLLAIFTNISRVSSVRSLPRETSASENVATAEGWTPKPTSIPAGRLEIRGSSRFSTCGYVSGRLNDVVTCRTGFCGYANHLLGCCDKTLPNGAFTGCSYYTTCYNYGHCGLDCVRDKSAFACPSNEPFCIKYTFPEIPAAIGGCSTEPLIITASVHPDRVTRAPHNATMTPPSSIPLTVTTTPPLVSKMTSASTTGMYSSQAVGGPNGILPMPTKNDAVASSYAARPATLVAALLCIAHMAYYTML